MKLYSFKVSLCSITSSRLRLFSAKKYKNIGETLKALKKFVSSKKICISSVEFYEGRQLLNFNVICPSTLDVEKYEVDFKKALGNFRKKVNFEIVSLTFKSCEKKNVIPVKVEGIYFDSESSVFFFISSGSFTTDSEILDTFIALLRSKFGAESIPKHLQP